MFRQSRSTSQSRTFGAAQPAGRAHFAARRSINPQHSSLPAQSSTLVHSIATGSRLSPDCVSEPVPASDDDGDEDAFPPPFVCDFDGVGAGVVGSADFAGAAGAPLPTTTRSEDPVIELHARTAPSRQKTRDNRALIASTNLPLQTARWEEKGSEPCSNVGVSDFKVMHGPSVRTNTSHRRPDEPCVRQ